MKKFSSIFLAFMFLLLAGCRSDEFKWNNQTVGEDEYLVAFTASSPVVDVVGKTRSEANRDEITEVMLLMFDGNEADSELKAHFDVSGDNKTTYKFQTPSGTHQGSITLPISAVRIDGANTWYIVANANAKIKQAIKDKGTSVVTKDDLFKAVTFGSTQRLSQEDHVMIGFQTDVTPKAGQENAQVFSLERVYAKVTAEINTDLSKIPFRMTGMKLYKYADKGDLTRSLTAASELTPNTSETTGWIETIPNVELASTTDVKGQTFNHTAKGQQFATTTFPYTPVDTEDAEGEKILMVIKGYYETSVQETDPDVAPVVASGAYEFDTADGEVFYAIEMPALLANHHYRVLINGATTTGKTHLPDAVANPNTLTVDFIDVVDEIRNIVSDGENVLAVQDTLWVDAKQTDPVLHIKARAAGNSSPKIKFSSDQPLPGWIRGGLTLGSEYVGSKINSAAETAAGLFNGQFNLQLTLGTNQGAEREFTMTVSLEGSDLSRNITIIQRRDEDAKYDQLFKVKLEILRDNSVKETIEDYLYFIQSGVTNTTSGDQVNGILPDENGNRQRNLGLHMPMPNGGNVTYRYSLWKTAAGEVDFTVPSAYRVGTGRGTSTSDPLILEFKDGDNYDYVVQPDLIKVISGTGESTVEFTLDLYHTGFFWKHAAVADIEAGWYYYEAFKMRSSGDLRWLDRNLGAKSAGMGSLNESQAITSNAWPIVGDKAMGGRFNMTQAESACPTGWEVPSFAMMRAMTVQAAFNTESMSTVPDKVPFFAPTFTFTGKDGTKTVSIRSYFPQNRYTTNGVLDGSSQTGYYLTTTGTGTDGWYQAMSFNGTNASSVNLNNSKVKMSVRPVSGNYSLESETKYSCNVYGYTHVFLYYEYNGVKTYFNTWPGEQVALISDLDRYHPFELTSSIDYSDAPGDVYVIFNRVDEKGEVKLSNVSAANVLKRDGIKFKNGGSYVFCDPTSLEGAINGNWDITSKSSKVGFVLKKSAAGSNNFTYAKIKLNDNGSEVIVGGEQGDWMDIGNDYWFYSYTVHYSDDYANYLEACKDQTAHGFGNVTPNKLWNDDYVSGPITISGMPANMADEVYMISYSVSASTIPAPTWAPPRTDKDWKVAFIWKTGVDGTSNWANLWFKRDGAETVVNTDWNGRFSNNKVFDDYYYHTLTMTVPTDYTSFQDDPKLEWFNQELVQGTTRSWSQGYHKKLTTVPTGIVANEAYLIWAGDTQPADPGTVTPPPVSNAKYYLAGDYTGSWDNSEKEMSESNGKWSVTVTSTKNHNFQIRKKEDGKDTVYIKSDGDNASDTDITLGVAKSCKESGNKDFWVGSYGTYTYTFDPTAMTITVTGSGTVDPPTPTDESYTLVFYWPQYAKDGKNCYQFNVWDLIDKDGNKCWNSDAQHQGWFEVNNSGYYHYVMENIKSYSDAWYRFKSGDQNVGSDTKLTNDFEETTSYPAELKAIAASKWRENHTIVLKYKW